MRTAEEWDLEWKQRIEELIRDTCTTDDINKAFFDLLREIQDEAIAHGMTLSAEIVSKHWNSQYDLVNQKAQASRSEQSILTARDNKVWRKE